MEEARVAEEEVAGAVVGGEGGEEGYGWGGDLAGVGSAE